MQGDRRNLAGQANRKNPYEDADIGFAVTPLERPAAVEEPAADGFTIGAGRLILWGVTAGMVLAGGLYAGLKLRRWRLRRAWTPYQAYESYEDHEVFDTETGTEYGAVGI